VDGWIAWNGSLLDGLLYACILCNKSVSRYNVAETRSVFRGKIQPARRLFVPSALVDIVTEADMSPFQGCWVDMFLIDGRCPSQVDAALSGLTR
jgi:hypothetical protein